MQPGDATRPEVWAEFESILKEAECNLVLQAIDRFDFYRAASTDQHALNDPNG